MLDTFTSLLAGFTIFGILGNLAHELNVEDIRDVTTQGYSLAFVSYPDAISKFTAMPQVGYHLSFFYRFLLFFSKKFDSRTNYLNLLICN